MVDDKSVAMPMIKNGDRKNCTAVAEFTLSRVSSIRSGNNVFVRYYEGTYDTYFQAPDLYWSIIKKTDRQCMLLFLTGSFIVCAHSFPLPCLFYMGDFVVMAYLMQ